MKSEDKTKTFIERALALHGPQYDYSKTIYAVSYRKVSIECPKHGEFTQTPNSHLQGYGCPACGIEKSSRTNTLTTEEFIARAKAKYGDRYDYSRVEYSDSKTKVAIVCPEHGEFKVQPGSLLSGYGCKKCGDKNKGSAKKLSPDMYIKSAIEKHGDRYDYSRTRYERNTVKVTITCRKHGDFSMRANSHLRGQGCMECAKELKSEKRRLSPEQFVERASAIHGDKYDYSLVTPENYINNRIYVPIICKDHGVFEQTPMTHLNGCGCWRCACKNTSAAEIEIAEYIESKGIKVSRNDRGVLGGPELDMYLPDIKLAVEYDGLYWHSEEFKGRKYHIDKTTRCNLAGVDLIHVFEDEWVNKSDIVKSIISNRAGVLDNRYYARKLKVEKISAEEARIFYVRNHIQGFAGGEHYALKAGDKVVSAATFAKPRRIIAKKPEHDLELIRYCNALHTTVVGGFSRLLSVVKGKKVITYCDNRLFNASGYKAVGFKEIRRTEPAYWYVKGQQRLSRFAFQKHKLPKVLEKFDPELTEVANMKANGYIRIFDCGTTVLEYG